MAAGPRVEFLWWQGCPSADRALEMLKREMRAAGLDPDAVEVGEVNTDEEVRQRNFRGSPTIRIDGVDIDAGDAEEEPIGLTCRVYRRSDGRVSPLPDAEKVRSALIKAAGGGKG
jgi:hypothetical protein